MIAGILASTGIAYGETFLLKKEPIIVNPKNIIPKNVHQEITKFIHAKNKTIKQLKIIQEKSNTILNKKTNNIFYGHIMILEDIELEKEIICFIKNNLHTADFAIQKIFSEQIKQMNQIDDTYLKNRIIDMKDIKDRLLKNVLNLKNIDLQNIKKKVIIITKELTPSETAQINFKYILGFITDLGGETSHTSIIARSLEIPAIVGTGNITQKVKKGDYVILDGIKNKILINPDQENIKIFKKKKIQYALKKKALCKLKKLNAVTIDNHKVKISANVSNINDINNAQKYGAESIGLYRTEFLFMQRNTLPSEEEQFQAYKQAVLIMKNKSIIVRTMDIGGDKNLPYLNLPKEENPFLGCRAIRIGMTKKEILHVQLTAILRASIFGKLKILFPMIISLEEIQTLKIEIEKIKYDLKKKKILFDKNIQVGIMIETPASAIISNLLIQEVDFFSIGTNDLTQYTLAVDRGNDLISHLYNPMSPSVLKLIQKVIDNSHAHNKWTGMCGELASNTKATILLLGMGLNEFSMNPSSIPEIKKIIRENKFEYAQKLAKLVLSQTTSTKIIQTIDNFIKQ